MPVELEFREALPRTPVGKLSKKELIEEEKQKRAKSSLAEAVNA
jgi:long-chain acyl-CoA synthetase